MAKAGDKTSKSGADENEAEAAASRAMDAISEALREAGKRATDLAQNPYARSLLAAGLVTAAAALAANKNVRDATRRNIRDATQAAEMAAEVAADNASKVGAAIINAATEAVQRVMSLGAGAAADAEPEKAPAAPTEKRAAPAKATAPRKPQAAKPASAASGATKSRKPAAKASGSGSAAAKGRRSPAKKSPTKAS